MCGVYLLLSSCATHTALWYSSYIKQYTLHAKLNFTTGNVIMMYNYLHSVDCTVRRWHFNFEITLEFCRALIKWWYDDIWVYLLGFVWNSDFGVCIKTRYTSPLRLELMPYDSFLCDWDKQDVYWLKLRTIWWTGTTNPRYYAPVSKLCLCLHICQIVCQILESVSKHINKF